MKVKELIKQLQELDGEKEINMFSYDTSSYGGESIDIDCVEEYEKYVMIW